MSKCRTATHFHFLPRWRQVRPTYTLHIVSHVNRVKLVGQEAVAEVHPLLLSPRVDGNHTRIHYHHHADDQVVLLQDDIRHQGDQIQSLVFIAVEFHDDD